ncbi:MAG TPA: aspartate kinase [Ktedonobacteraceae bacterium]|nr:aspartate kinase [Ktedonobacteraceae bacterium]
METRIQILKFGGTSVGSGERIRRVAQIIAHKVHDTEEDFPVVVVSAMAGVTDQLLRIAKLAYLSEHDQCEAEFLSLKEKHLEAAKQLLLKNEDRSNQLVNNLEVSFSGLQQDIDKLKSTVSNPLTPEISLKTAAIGAWGERLSVLLVTAAVRNSGVNAAPIQEEAIITTNPSNESHQTPGTVVGAEPLTEETRINAQKLAVPLIERKIVPVIPGFIGRTTAGIVTTLGRNGSDYSATVIGAALDCTEVSIYTDVDGVLSADPRIVANARLLTRLSYAEAARLSWFGAKVLHPRTLIPIAYLNIPVRVRNTFRPHSRGTVVASEKSQRSSAAAITVRHQLALITVENTDMFGASENAGQVFALASRAGAAPVAICSSSGNHLSFMVEEQAADSILELLQHDMGSWRVTCQHDLAACACIGSGFSVDPMSPARAITALARERIPVITQGASDSGIILIVEDQDSERALRCLHRDLIAPVIPLVRHGSQEKRREAR